jgi:cytochrome c553
MNIFKSFVLAICVLALGACGDKKDDDGAATKPAPAAQPGTAQPAQPATPAAAASPAEQANTMFTTVCAACHGTSGKGDGPSAASLNPKPRDYTSAEWQQSTTDEEIATIIVKGGPAVGKSPMMPPQAHLADKPEVVDELVKLIRGFGPQDGAGGGDTEGGEGGGDETAPEEG